MFQMKNVTYDVRTGNVFTRAAPGKKQLVNISLARSAIDANKSFRGAISYPYTTVMIVDAVNLSDVHRQKPDARRTEGTHYVRRWASMSAGACKIFLTSWWTLFSWISR